MNLIRTKYSDASWSDRGAKDANGDYAETRIPHRPCVVIELAFHDSCDRDAAYLKDNCFRSMVTWAIYKGVCTFFGVMPTWDLYSYEIVSDDIPDVMDRFETRDVHITLRNRGCLWNEAQRFRLGAVDDSDPLTAQTRITIPTEVEPDQDNTAVGFFGAWSTGTTAPDKYGDDYCYAGCAISVGRIARWIPDIDVPGIYSVSVWYPQAANQSTIAPFTII
jgi:hypothetical protein